MKIRWYTVVRMHYFGNKTKNSLSKILFRAGVLTLTPLLVAASFSAVAQGPNADLTTTSLEDLMNIEVTSVSKKEERLFQAAAAVYVITQEEIRRSGLSSVPELLRLVPGVQVALIDGTKWAITVRGFNGRLSNKLLVLIDGRSVYSPETSGVYWEVQDLLLEDIERIEVIRGPGGTLWGANAVNGVINIITRHTSETKGEVLTAGFGTEDRGLVSFRHGAKIGDKASYRLYGKYFIRNELVDATGLGTNDGQQSGRVGGRVDWQPTERDSLTLEGDIYKTHLHENFTGVSIANPLASLTNRKAEFNGGHVKGRWERALSPLSEIQLQLFYDRFSRKLTGFKTDIDTFDIDFQHHVSLGRTQDIVWGIGYRRISHRVESDNTSSFDFNPKSKTEQLFSGFAQYQINLVKNRLRMIGGVKLEHNYLSGFEVQPSVRLVWTPSRSQTAWLAVSRAVRTPTRSQQDIRINFEAFPGPGGLPVITTVFGSMNPKSEVLYAYEFGYRAQPHRKFSLDLATFYNVYDRLRSFEPGLPFLETDPLPPRLVVPIYLENLLRGETYGLELTANLDITNRWKLRGSYSFLRVQLHAESTSVDTVSEAAEGNSPRHQFQVHSYLNLWRNVDLDASLYQVARLRSQQVPGYTRVDLRLGWHIRENVEVSAGVQNLLNRRHPEFDGFDSLVVPSQVKRSFYGRMIFRF